MNHETIHELLALRLYEEIDDRERAALEQHLSMCADCRLLASELAAGLGTVRAPSRGAGLDEPPAEWVEKLRVEAGAVRPHRRISPWWTAAAGFAAGLLSALAIAQRGAHSTELARVDPTWGRFYRATPPPQATTTGQLAHLWSYLER